jgi:transposase-like protein
MDVNTQCPRCAAPRGSIVRDGFYHRADDSKSIQRMKCKECGKKFSAATFKPTYRQKKRRINSTVRFCFASNMCPRDIAELVGVNIKTIAARLIWQATLSREKNKHYLAAFVAEYGPINTVQFDDLVTFEHTKCKPLTVPIAVVDGKRIPLGFRVASIPAFGHLAAIARKRYGKRVDRSRIERRDLFEQLRDVLPPDVEFKTDGHEHYATLIKHYFPDSVHHVYKSARGAVVGQGELKKITYDHLFSVNHTFASIRAKVNRLNRRTWCTTKHPERLADHIDIFIDVFCDRLKAISLSQRAIRNRGARAMASS